MNMGIKITFEADSKSALDKMVMEYLGMYLSVYPTQTSAMTDPPKQTRTRTPKEDAKQPENPKQDVDATPAEDKQQPETSAVDGDATTASLSEDEPTTLSYDDVRSKVLLLSREKGREAVVDLLKHFGAEKNAQDIDPSRWPEVLTYIGEKMGAA